MVIRQIISYAALMHFYFKIHTLVLYFQSSTATEMLILCNNRRKVTIILKGEKKMSSFAQQNPLYTDGQNTREAR